MTPEEPSFDSAEFGSLPGAPDWRVQWHATVVTTQTLARDLAPWHAVIADAQSAGRGQAQRSFVSDAGGLYFTAVLPYRGDPLESRGFALAVGHAAREALVALGFEVRLRWPNDLLIGARKVAGILVEQGRRDTLLVGLGLNVSNSPWQTAPELRAIATSLSEHALKSLPLRATIAAALLHAIRGAHDVFSPGGLAALAPQLNAAWARAPRAVEVERVGGAAPVRGVFLGIDRLGALMLDAGDCPVCAVPAHHVERLREL